MGKFTHRAWWQAIVVCAAVGLLTGCARQEEPPAFAGRDVRVTILHTADLHSRLLPHYIAPTADEQAWGLDPELAPFGGVARIATVLQYERGQAARVLYVDSGDLLQGSAMIDVFGGVPEQRVLSQLRPDAVAIGNHEFDDGIDAYATLVQNEASYPLLAANYLFTGDSPLRDRIRAVHLTNVGGLRVGFIGIANRSSLWWLTDIGNRYGILALDTAPVVQEWIDLIAPQVDLIVGVSHAGLNEDREIIAATRGFDIVLGGHQHAIADQTVIDAAGRTVRLIHSGAFGHFVGKVDLVLRDGEVQSHRYSAIPIDSTLREDSNVLIALEPFKLQLQATLDLRSAYAHAPTAIARHAEALGDSPLGNLIADAMRLTTRTDIALTHTRGLRADLGPGALSLDTLYHAVPYNDDLVTMFVSGADLQATLDFAAAKSAGRGCRSQLQVSGIEFAIDCRPASQACPDCPRAVDVVLTSCDPETEAEFTAAGRTCPRSPIRPDAIYEVATNHYLARGGSGYVILGFNPTTEPTGLSIRDAAIEWLQRDRPCTVGCDDPYGRTDLQRCERWVSCVEDLTEFQNRYCGPDETSEPSLDTPAYCGQDDQACAEDTDCIPVQALCAGGGCNACVDSGDCQDTLCDGGTCRCLTGFCVPDRTVCAEGRCTLACTSDSDCPNHAEGDGVTLCRNGGCVAVSAVACVDDTACHRSAALCLPGASTCEISADCAEGEVCDQGLCVPDRPACTTDGDCEGGLGCRFGRCDTVVDCAGCAGPCIAGGCQQACSTCSDASHCPPNHVCAGARCVPKLAECRDRRCRTLCEGSGVSDCVLNQTCDGTVCVPNACKTPLEAEARCRIENESLALERCLSMACTNVRDTGRIEMQLPPDGDTLPDDLNPDDPEG